MAGTGTLVAATVGGIATTTNNASATVTGEFTVPDGETTLTGEELTDIRLQADAEWNYSSNVEIHGVELELHAGATPDTMDMLARYEDTDLGASQLSGEDTLSGSLVNTSDFSLEHFQPTSGTVSTNVVAELRFYALRRGEVVASATKSEGFAVTVTKEELEVSVSVGGTGSVTFETGADNTTA